MGIPYNRIEGYGTSDRLIIRNQGVISALKHLGILGMEGIE